MRNWKEKAKELDRLQNEIRRLLSSGETNDYHKAKGLKQEADLLIGELYDIRGLK